MYPQIHIVLPSYGTLAVLGGITVMIFLFFRIEKYEIPFSNFLKMMACCIICGAIGSRVVFVISRIPWLIANFSLKALLSNVLGGGFVFYGGLFGVLFGMFGYSAKAGLDKNAVKNMFIPAIPLFHSIGRIGCLLSGCCYGFKLPSAISIFGVITIDRFPTQIIESVFNLVLFLILLIAQRKREHIDWLKVYLLSYATFRFIIEFSRGDLMRGVFFGISTSQLISVSVIVFYIIMGIKNRKQKSVEISA